MGIKNSRQSSNNNPNQSNNSDQMNLSTTAQKFGRQPSSWKRMQHPSDPESKMAIFRVYGRCYDFPEVVIGGGDLINLTKIKFV